MSDAGTFQHILVPVDFVPAEDDAVEEGRAVVVGNQALEFTRASEEAVRLAATVARGTGGTLRLLHGTPPMNVASVYTGPVAVPAKVVNDIHERAKATSMAALEVALARS